MLKPETSHVESHSRAALKNYIIQASTLLEIVLSGPVLIGLLLTMIPLIKCCLLYTSPSPRDCS